MELTEFIEQMGVIVNATTPTPDLYTALRRRVITVPSARQMLAMIGAGEIENATAAYLWSSIFMEVMNDTVYWDSTNVNLVLKMHGNLD